MLKVGQLIYKSSKQFYRSGEWLRKRAEVLERDNNECQKCKQQGKFKKADCVHHIKHLEHRPDLALTDDNLTSLCGTCHNSEHPEKLRKNRYTKKFINVERW